MSDQSSGSTPVFSVIVPTYNRPELLRRAITSVRRQTFRDFELIVVDDGSQTPCEAVLSDLADERIRLIRNRANLGVSESRNTGVEAARGKYVSFLDDDDEYKSTFLSSTFERLEGTPASVGVSWCSVEYIRYGKEQDREQSRDVREFATEYESTAALFRKFLSIGLGFGVTFKATCLKEIGRFNPDLRESEDTDFFFRVLSSSFVPIVVPGIHVVLHDHKLPRLRVSRMSPEHIRTYEGFLREYSKFMDEYPPVRRDLLRYLASLKTVANAS